MRSATWNRLGVPQDETAGGTRPDDRREQLYSRDRFSHESKGWTRVGLALGLGAGLWLGTGVGIGGDTIARAAGGAATGSVLLSQRLDFGGEAANLTVRGDGTITVQSGTQEPFTTRASAGTAPTALKTARAEVAAGGEARYLLVRVQTVSEGQRILVLGKDGDRWASIYTGPIGQVGRDGEYAVAVEATSQGLLRYQRAPGLSRCDGEDRLFIERYQGGTWRPAPELAIPDLADAPVIAVGKVPGAAAGPPLGVYRFVAASAQVGVQRADLLAPPQELEDGKPTTAWRVPADSRGAFVTARADGAGHSVQALRITPAAGAAGTLPRQLALLFDGRDPGAKKRFLVNLSARDGEALWVPFPAAVPSSCLSILITQPGPGAQLTALGKVAIFSELDADTSDAGLRQLAERAATAEFTSAESALRTLRAIVERERSSGLPRSKRAAALLQAVSATLPTAQGAGRRRLHEVLRALAQGGPWPELGPVLVRALSQADPEERPPLWAAVEQLGAGAESVLQQLARDRKLSNLLRTEAIKRLGGLSAPVAVPMLLELLTTLAEGTAEERVLQRSVVAGLSAALRCRPAAASAAAPAGSAAAAVAAGDNPQLAAALAALPSARASSFGKPAADELPLSQLGSAALLVEALGQALSGCPQPVRSQVSARLVSLWPPSSPPPGAAEGEAQREQALFTLRYRILQSLERLAVPTSDAVTLVGQVLAQDSEPVLRQAAARAAVAGAEDGSGAVPAVSQALADRDAGVRLAVLIALTEHRVPAVLSATEQALRTDRWPGVRRAAVDSRAAQCQASPSRATAPVTALRQAVSDADEQVQRQALAGLGRCEGAAALDVYTARLKDSEAAPALRSQACALLIRYGFSIAAASQQTQAHATVAAALVDLLSDPAADERTAGTVISCARAVGELGDARDLPVLMQTATATASEVPPPIRQSALEAIGKICSRGATLSPALRKDLAATFQSAAKDPEARVKTAAERAATRCR